MNGIRAVAKKGFLEWMKQEDPDILCLQETKAEPGQLSKELLHIEGYTSHFSSSTVKKGYSGVVTYTKVPPLEVEHGFGIPRFDDEGRTVLTRYKDFTLLNIYYPNGAAREERLHYKMAFYDAFLDFVEGLRKKGENLIICGDVNTAHKEIDIARPKENEDVSGFLPMEREWLDTFLAHGYVDTFRMFNDQGDNYTWWHLVTRARERNVGWRIDYFFVNEAFKHRVKNAFILSDVMGSDHCPIGIEIE